MSSKENNIDFEYPDGSVIANGDFSGEIVAGEWTVLDEVSLSL